MPFKVCELNILAFGSQAGEGGQCNLFVHRQQPEGSRNFLSDLKCHVL